MANDNLYYVLELFLDPGETNPTKLDGILKQKISEWNKKANMGGGGFKSKVEQAKRWQEDLKTKSFGLRKLLEDARDHRLFELDDEITNLEGDGVLERAEYDYLVKTYSPYFKESTIRSRIHLEITEEAPVESGFTIPVEPQLPPGVKPISDIMMANIDNGLAIYNSDPVVSGGRQVHDLYELIGCSKGNSISILTKKVQELQQKNLKRPKKTSGVDAEGQLLGWASVHFKTEDSKKSYDYSLKRKPIADFKKKKGGAWALRALKKRVTIQEYMDSVQEALNCGIDKSEAEWLVYDFFCNKSGCPCPFGNISNENREKAEPLIQKARDEINAGNYKDAEKTLLEIATLIPNSQEVDELKNGIARSLKQQAAELINVGKFDDAEVLISKAVSFLPDDNGVEDLRQQLKKKRAEVQKREQEIKTLESKIRDHVQNRRIYQADILLKELRTLAPNSPLFAKEGKQVEKTLAEVSEKFLKVKQIKDNVQRISLCEEILLVASDSPEANAILQQYKKQREEAEKKEHQIQHLKSELRKSIQLHKFYEADALLQELCSLTSDFSSFDKERQQVEKTLAEVNERLHKLGQIKEDSQRLSLCEEILSISSDCEVARTELDRIPPIPPTELKTRIEANSIELTWKKTLSKSFTGYCVVRKVGGIPTSVQDGERLIEHTADTHFSDTKAEMGVIYGYGVWTLRDKLASRKGCFSELVQAIGDIKFVNVKPDDRSLSLSWTQPGKLLGVVVTRWESGLSKPQKTIFRHLGNKNSFVDANLNNGTLYNYLIQAIYRGLDGHEILSKGVQVTGMPCPAPKPVNDLRAGIRKGLLVFNWTPPEHGDFYIFYSDNCSKIEPGHIETRSITDLTKIYGPPIPLSIVRTGIATSSVSKTGVLNFLPVTLINGNVAYGKGATVTVIQDVSKLRLRITSEILLKWNWPENVYEVKILWRRDTVPISPNDPKAEFKRVRRSRGDSRNTVGNTAFRKSCKNGYFMIYAYIPESKKYSQGVSVFAERTTLRYDFHIEGDHGVFDIQRTSINGKIPEMMVRRSSDHIPFNRNDGEWMMTTEPSDGKKQTIRIPLEGIELDEDQYVALFVNDEDKETFYAIDAPPMSELRLFLENKTEPKRSWLKRLTRSKK
ncbi:MAG: hypothetical protein IKE69_04705 [Thermoguttaceae bacterium]|nr:hypothetical protein [Thermoguttaceae bacterium]